jgi:hypothetical protein
MKKFLLLSIVLVLVAGPGVARLSQWRQVNDCAVIIRESSPPSPLEEVTSDTVEGWLQRNYRIDVSDTNRPFWEEDLADTSLTWRTRQGRSYGLSLAEGKADAFSVVFIPPSPTADKFIECFGPPQLYEASLREINSSPWIRVELWYPDRGMIVETGLPPEVHTGLRMDGTMVIVRVLWLESEPLESMVEHYSDEGTFRSNTVDTATKLQLLKPWPGSWQETTVENLLTPTPVGE